MAVVPRSEIIWFVLPFTLAFAVPAPPDSDRDGLSDDEELALGTDPLDEDTDHDGLRDRTETLIRTDPLLPDTDEDGLDDFTERFVLETDPRLADSDFGGQDDGLEVLTDGTDPLDRTDDRDDKDGDGLLDPDERIEGTLHRVPDSDEDLLLDGDEVHVHHTDPLVADTDGGGVPDGVEVTVDGTDPLDGSDDLVPAPAEPPTAATPPTTEPFEPAPPPADTGPALDPGQLVGGSGVRCSVGAPLGGGTWMAAVLSWVGTRRRRPSRVASVGPTH